MVSYTLGFPLMTNQQLELPHQTSSFKRIQITFFSYAKPNIFQEWNKEGIQYMLFFKKFNKELLSNLFFSIKKCEKEH
jgi:hypothetical protein